jgi:hypothetical protein
MANAGGVWRPSSANGALNIEGVSPGGLMVMTSVTLPDDILASYSVCRKKMASGGDGVKIPATARIFSS